MFKLTLYYKLKWIKFSVEKKTKQNIKKIMKKKEKNNRKAGNFVTPEKFEPRTGTTFS